MKEGSVSPHEISQQNQPSETVLRKILQRAGFWGFMGIGTMIPQDTSMHHPHPVYSLEQKSESVVTPSLENGPEETEYQYTASLSHLREQGLFPKEKAWAVTANAESFEKLAETFFNTPQTKELFLSSELSFVYPGSGVHIAPLEMIRLMGEKSKALRKVRITYTEINYESFVSIDEVIKQYVENTPGLRFIRVVVDDGREVSKKDTQEMPHSKVISYEFTKPDGNIISLEIHFEYKMSGSKWFQKKVGRDADIILLHDTNAGITKTWGDVGVLLDNLDVSERPKGKKLFTIIENDDLMERDDNNFSNDFIYDMAGTVVATQGGFHFGCGENHFDDEEQEVWHRKNEDFRNSNTRASVLDIDIDTIKEIYKIGGEEAMQGFLLLGHINLSGYNQKNYETGYKSLEKVYEITKSEKLKNLIKNLVEKNLKRWTLRESDKKENSDLYKLFQLEKSIIGSVSEPNWIKD